MSYEAPAAMLSAVAPPMERDVPGKCNECGSTDIIEDWKQGNSVCRGCGLVVVDQLVDLGSEWRTFDDDSGGDPNRVGGPTNPLLEGGLGTGIGAAPKGGNIMGSGGLSRVQNKNAVSNTDKVLLNVMGRIDSMCNRLSLPGRVSKRAKELFKSYQDHLTLKKDGTRKRSLRADETQEIIAASVFIACKNEGISRMLAEIVPVALISKKEIAAMGKKIESAVKGAKSRYVQSSSDFVTRCCNQLGLSRELTNVCAQVARAAQDQENVYGKTTATIAAASIFVVLQLAKNDDYRSTKQIAEVAGVAEGTIRTTYRLMQPHLAKIIPKDFKWEKELEKLKAT